MGGSHDGALVVRVTEPAAAGRANSAALLALAAALGVPRPAVTLVRGAASRRKLVEVRLPATEEAAVGDRLAGLMAAPGR